MSRSGYWVARKETTRVGCRGTWPSPVSVFREWRKGSALRRSKRVSRGRELVRADVGRGRRHVLYIPWRQTLHLHTVWGGATTALERAEMGCMRTRGRAERRRRRRRGRGRGRGRQGALQAAGCERRGSTGKSSVSKGGTRRRQQREEVLSVSSSMSPAVGRRARNVIASGGWRRRAKRCRAPQLRHGPVFVTCALF